MARYIDADALAEQMLNRYRALVNEYGDYDHYTTGYDDAIDEIEKFPTADVAPKSEVAREIFAEIYKIMNSTYCEVQHRCVGIHTDTPEAMMQVGKLQGVIFLGDEIAELKKKYTEGKE